MESEIGRNTAMEHGIHNEEAAPTAIGSEFVDKPLQVNADNTENTSAPVPQKQHSTHGDTGSPPPKPIKRSTTLSSHKEGAIDKDRDARKAKAESKYLDKCDRLEQITMSSKLSEAKCNEKQHKLDERYQKKLDKIDKRYNHKIEKAERKSDKGEAKQEETGSSSQSSTRASSAPSTPMREPKKNKVKSFFNSIQPPSNPAVAHPSSLAYSSKNGGASSGGAYFSTFNPAVGGAAMPAMGGAGVGGSGGCDGGGGGACGTGASGC